MLKDNFENCNYCDNLYLKIVKIYKLNRID